MAISGAHGRGRGLEARLLYGSGQAARSYIPIRREGRATKGFREIFLPDPKTFRLDSDELLRGAPRGNPRDLQGRHHPGRAHPGLALAQTIRIDSGAEVDGSL